jgi:hypothetical protein
MARFSGVASGLPPEVDVEPSSETVGLTVERLMILDFINDAHVARLHGEIDLECR